MINRFIPIFLTWKEHFFSITKTFLFLLGTIWKSFFWFVLTLFFGLLQIWLILTTNLLQSMNHLSFEQLIESGALLFFSVTIVSSLTIDYIIFSRGIFSWKENTWTIFIFVIFPSIIVSICISLFILCYFTPIEKLNIDAIFLLEIVTFTFTFIYAMIVKSFAFYKDQKCSI